MWTALNKMVPHKISVFFRCRKIWPNSAQITFSKQVRVVLALIGCHWKIARMRDLRLREWHICHAVGHTRSLWIDSLWHRKTWFQLLPNPDRRLHDTAVVRLISKLIMDSGRMRLINTAHRGDVAMMLITSYSHFWLRTCSCIVSAQKPTYTVRQCDNYSRK